MTETSRISTHNPHRVVIYKPHESVEKKVFVVGSNGLYQQKIKRIPIDKHKDDNELPKIPIISFRSIFSILDGIQTKDIKNRMTSYLNNYGIELGGIEPIERGGIGPVGPRHNGIGPVGPRHNGIGPLGPIGIQNALTRQIPEELLGIVDEFIANSKMNNPASEHILKQKIYKFRTSVKINKFFELIRIYPILTKCGCIECLKKINSPTLAKLESQFLHVIDSDILTKVSPFDSLLRLQEVLLEVLNPSITSFTKNMEIKMKWLGI